MSETDILNVRHLPLFRIITVLGSVSDVYYNEQIRDYTPINDVFHGAFAIANSPWHSTLTIVENMSLELILNQNHQHLLTEEVSLILSVGIEFGTVGFTGEAMEVKYAGSGKILKVG